MSNAILLVSFWKSCPYCIDLAQIRAFWMRPSCFHKLFRFCWWGIYGIWRGLRWEGLPRRGQMFRYPKHRLRLCSWNLRWRHALMSLYLHKQQEVKRYLKWLRRLKSKGSCVRRCTSPAINNDDQNLAHRHCIHYSVSCVAAGKYDRLDRTWLDVSILASSWSSLDSPSYKSCASLLW